MKILVTGCAGYIGSTLTPYLLAQGYEVIGVDSFWFNNQEAIFPWVGHEKLQIHKVDVRNTERMKVLYGQADIIIPLAALVGAPICDKYPESCIQINQLVILEMIKLLSPCQRVLFPNTNSGYGVKGETECYEFSELEPISLYGKTKCWAEHAILDHPNSIVFRLATVCGVSPRMRFDLMLNDFASKLYYRTVYKYDNFSIFEPSFKRNFVHVRDVASAFIWMLNKEQSGVYNLGNPSMNMTKLQLAEKICDYYGLAKTTVAVGEGKDPDQRNYLVNNDKILRTGFQFKWGLEPTLDEIAKLCGYCSPDDISKMRNV